jgi:uncharacterized protein (TIGR03000 family)
MSRSLLAGLVVLILLVGNLRTAMPNYGTYTSTENIAHITVRLPDRDARVWFEDQLTSQSGAVRTFESPELTSGQEYMYTIRAEWREGGRTVTQTRRVYLHAGDRVTVDFTQDKEQPQKDFPQHTRVTITKIDAKKGEITVKYTDDKGKEEQTFKLTRDVNIFDETGRNAAIDVFESGDEALILAAQGQLKELRHAAEAPSDQRLSDAVKTLIEMTDSEQGCVLEVQRIYDMLRKLDTGKNGKIDPAALKAERERIVAERVKKIFDHLDTNRDGKITKDEAKGLIKEHFDKIDRNGDGAITYEELLQAAQEKDAPKAPSQEKK